MDFDLSPTQLAFRDEVRAFVRDRLPDDIRQRLRQGHPPSKQDTVTWQRILHERGWAAPHWPRAHGGAELGQLERLILMDELYRAPAPLPQVFNITMLGPVLMRFGTREQQQHFLPRLARLDLWFCQGFSEPGAGSDLASLRTSADARATTTSSTARRSGPPPHTGPTGSSRWCAPVVARTSRTASPSC